MAVGPTDPRRAEIVEVALTTIAGWARDGRLGYYSELAAAVNDELPDAGLEAHGQPMNRLLFDVVSTARAFDPSGPMLSAVVVFKDRDNREPGDGFYTLGQQLGLYDGSQDQGDRAGFWGEQFNACSRYWTATREREFSRWLREHGVWLWEPPAA